MKIQRDFRKWETLLGLAELATVIIFTWQQARRLTQLPPVSSAAPPGPDPAIAPASDGSAMTGGAGEAVAALVAGGGFSVRALGQIGVAAARSWSERRAASKGAALALYTLFSLAPMLVLVVAVAGLFFGVDAVRALVLKQMSGMLGAQGADAVQSILAGAHYQSDSLTAAVVSGALVLLGATSAFSELKNSLDELWGVPEKGGGGIWSMVQERFLSFGLVLVLALMLLISLTVSTALAALGDILVGSVANAAFLVFAKLVSAAMSFLIVTALFAAIYKYLPAARIAWRDVILGALITSILFLGGKFVIGLYLATTNFSSGYGAAGSLVLLVSWIYYSAQIFFYGALFTHEHAVRSGRALRWHHATLQPKETHWQSNP